MNLLRLFVRPSERFVAALVALACAGIGCHRAAFWLEGLDIPRPGPSMQHEVILLPRPGLVGTLVFGTLIVGLLAGYRFLRESQEPRPSGLRWMALLLAGSQFLLFPVHLLRWGGWKTNDMATGPDGRTYYALSASAMPNIHFALAYRLAHQPFYDTVQTVGSRTRYDEDDLPLLVVRSDGTQSGSGRGSEELAFGNREWVACLDSWGCRMAYNTRTKRTYRGKELRQLSPFFLIGPGEQPLAEDLAKIKRTLAVRPEWRPPTQVVARDLQHPIAAIRTAARDAFQP